MHKEKITIRRAGRNGQHPYMQIERRIAQDLSLSLTERGMLFYIMSLEEGWSVYLKEIAKINKTPYAKAIKIFEKLQELGYCQIAADEMIVFDHKVFDLVGGAQ